MACWLSSRKVWALEDVYGAACIHLGSRHGALPGDKDYCERAMGKRGVWKGEGCKASKVSP